MRRNLAELAPLAEDSGQFSLEYVERKGAIRLTSADGRPVVGLVDPGDELLKSELRLYLGSEAIFEAVDRQSLAEFLSGEFSQVQSREEGQKGDRLLLDRLANDAPVVNLANNILLEGIRLGCSDIHLESLPGGAGVRYRVDGFLSPGRSLPREIFPSLSSRLKIMANLNIIERRLPQDGRLVVKAGGRDVEFRISAVPLADGESIVLRLFRRGGGLARLEELGFSPAFVETLRSSARSSNGLILVTGPTGSGKTTTLNALVRELATPEKKVITIEDPVENVIAGASQIQTNDEIGLTFEMLLKRILRQDPNILMVGEIRDRKTSELAIRAALTGHLVLSTLHTNDALSSIQRLTNMGAEPYLLGAVLRAVAAQRLVRKICPTCRRPASASPSQRAWIVERLGREPPPSFRGGGCDACGGLGYSGRTAVAEIFQIDENVEEMIVAGRRKAELAEHFRKRQGTVFLLDDAMEKVGRGETTLDEVERVVFGR